MTNKLQIKPSAVIKKQDVAIQKPNVEIDKQDIVLKIPKKLYKPLYGSNAQFNVIYGGRSSGKTTAVTDYIITMVLKNGVDALVLRDTESSIENSVYSQFVQQIYKRGLQRYFSIQYNKIICTIPKRKNGEILKDAKDKLLLPKIDFFGVREKHESLKGIAEYGIFFIDEARFLTKKNGGLLIPTLARYKKSRIFFCFNPEEKSDFIYDKFITHYDVQKKIYGDRLQCIKINWYENEYSRNNDSIIAEEKADKLTLTPEDYNHRWNGDILDNSNSLIFANKYVVSDFAEPKPEEIENGRFFFGVDWGYENPTAMVRCFIKKNHLGAPDLYIDYEAGGSKLQEQEIFDLFSLLPRAYDGEVIFADNNPPIYIQSMRELLNKRNLELAAQKQQRIFLNINPVVKKPGSVVSDIDFLKQRFTTIHIHKRCVRTINEFQNYRWKVNKNDDTVCYGIIEAGSDHFIDAMRYAFNGYISKASKYNKVLNVIAAGAEMENLSQTYEINNF